MTAVTTSDRPADRVPLIALFSANAISQIGNMLTAVAIPWFVLQTTGSAARTGISTVALTLPLFIVGLVGGGLVDRFSAKRLSVASDLLGCLAVAAIPLLYAAGWLTYPLLLLLVFLGTILDAPGGTARQSILPDLIARAAVAPERANAIYQAIFRFSILAGPPLAGLLIALFGTADVLWIDAATFAVSALLIGRLTPYRPPVPRPRGPRLAELTAGVSFMRRDRLLWSLLILFALVDLLANSLLLVVVPVYAARMFGSAFDYGVILSGLGGGMLVGTLLFGAVGQRLPRRATATLGLLLSGLPLCLLIGLPGLAATIAIFAVMGFGLGPSATLAMTVFQQRTPPELRGRVFGARFAIQTASIPAGALLTGALLEAAGLPATIAGIALLYLAVCAAALAVPALRELDGPDDTALTPPAAMTPNQPAM
jgi:MFS family permease